MAENKSACLKGIVFDAALDSLQNDLRTEVKGRGLHSVLDLRAMELATNGGFHGAIKRLPWASERPHSPVDFTSAYMASFVKSVVKWVIERDFQAVLAPAHFLNAGSRDPWLPVDLELVHQLRNSLDNAGARETLIYYPLAVRQEAFFHVVERDRLRVALSQIPIDALWLRIHRFGANCGAQALRRYIRACGDFHQSGRPIVPEKCGVAGLALLGLGAGGAVETGLTTGDQFDFTRLKSLRDKTKRGFAAPRVYVSELQAFMTIKNGRQFFKQRLAQAYYGCKDDDCCKRGVEDMLANPRRHFATTRLDEIARLNALPETVRPDEYVKQFLVPATAMLAKAAKAEPSLEKTRSHLEAWLTTLATVLDENRPTTFSPAPNGRRILMQRGA